MYILKIFLFMFSLGLSLAVNAAADTEVTVKNYKAELSRLKPELRSSDVFASRPSALKLDSNALNLKSGTFASYAFYLFAPETGKYQGKDMEFRCLVRRLSGTAPLKATFRCKLGNGERIHQFFPVEPPQNGKFGEFLAKFKLPDMDMEHFNVQFSFQQQGNIRNVWIIDEPVLLLRNAAETSEKIGKTAAAHSLGLAADRCRSPLPLIRDGRILFQIVLPEKPDAIARCAAQEIAEHFRLACGRTPEIVSEKNCGKRGIFIGGTELARSIGIEPARLPDNRIVTARVGENIILSGGDCPNIPGNLVYGRSPLPVGTLYAAYDFLEKTLGCRWYWPGKLGTHIPKTQNLSVGRLLETSAPVFHTRKTFYSLIKDDPSISAADMERWYRRNRFGGVYGDPIGMHAFNHWPAMYGKAHPDYFAMQPDGTRRNYEHAGGGHLCMTNPDVVREVVREKLKLFRENPFSRYSPVMPGDSLGLYYCRCERCQQELRPELGEKQSHSDAVWGFVSKVAGEVYEKAPDKFITCCAYANYSSPPSFPLLPNIAVTLCCDSPPSASLDYKNSFLAYLNAWKRTGAQLYAWDYWDTARRHRGTRGAPSFFARQLQETYLMSAGIVKGRAIELCEISADGKNQNGWANWMYDIQNLYVASRLLWDPSCNVDAVLENYCKDLYGPAADTIREFYDAMEERWLQHPANWNYETCWYQTYSPEFVDRMMALLRKAVLQTRGAEPYHARAQKTLEGFLPFEKASFLYRKPKRKQNPPVIRVPKTADWDRAAKIGNFCDSYNIHDITAKTKVFLRHDRKNLYLRFQSEFPPERKQILRADQCGERDALLWNYEGVEVFLAGEGETYYQFILSPDGKLADFRYPDGKLQWNSSGIRFSARHDGSNTWTGELSIPLSELKFDRTAPDGALKVNFYRNHYYREENGQWHWEQSCWLPVYGSFHDRNCFGKLYLEK